MAVDCMSLALWQFLSQLASEANGEGKTIPFRGRCLGALLLSYRVCYGTVLVYGLSAPLIPLPQKYSGSEHRKPELDRNFQPILPSVHNYGS